MFRSFFKPSLFYLFCLLLIVCSACAGKSRAVGDTGGMENGEYYLFLSNFQGNPLCMFVSVQKMRVFPWLLSPKTKWQVHSWLIYPGGDKALFYKEGKNKKSISTPLKWTKKHTVLFTTDKDQFFFYNPVTEDKLLLLTDSIFPGKFLHFI